MRLALAVVVAGLAHSQAPTVATIVNHGPTSNRYDMVILGDGYTAAQQAQFNADAQSVANALAVREPYATFWNYCNVHTVFRQSAQSGANQPDVQPPIVVNNAYGATFNTGGTARCLYITNTALASADAALAPANEGRVMVLVNDPRYGGCASQFAVCYNGPLMTEVEIHEIGHSLGLLADEYDYPYQTYTGGEPGEANITTSPVGQKWSYWVGTGGISAFQGAGYYLYGLYRPRIDCLMRSLGQQLCAVCAEQIVRVLNSVVSNIDQPSPAATTITLTPNSQQLFAFLNLVPPQNNPVITWKVDGVPQAGQNGTGFQFATGPATGPHTVQVSVLDQSAFVRQDPTNAMRDTFTWNVNVFDPTRCDLHAIAVSANPVILPPGTETDLVATVRNEGPAAAGTFRVEYFLSRDTTLTTTDYYLGFVDVPALAATTQIQVLHRVRVPSLCDPVLHYLFAVVDRTNVVAENDENNNQVMSAVVLTTPSCTPVLEYRDDLLYPRDAASVSIAAGGTALPTVIARCASPGTGYLIAWSVSGTAPGTTIAPGLTVPLNLDFATQIGLSGLNGPVFQAFWGTLDAQGVGRATFAWPPAPNLFPFHSNFAAVLLDGTPRFTGVTNAVTMDLLQ
jgi:hypothetical protein